jgi:peptide/nickel transport system substrate-binding protein
MQMSRRQAIQLGALAGVAILGGGGLLSACGSTSPESGDSGTPKRGGRLIQGLQGGSFADSLDPHLVMTGADFARYSGLYETLWMPTADGAIEQWLAESASANPTLDEWTIRLKQGIEFHNGKTVTADDVVFSVERLLDPNTGALSAGFLQAVDLTRTKVLDDRTVRFVLTTGLINFPESLFLAAPIIPRGFDIANPVGTGPFKLDSFEPGRQSVMVRHPNYWREGRPYADSLVHVNFSDDTARINALQGGQINIADFVSYPLARGLEQDSNLTLTRSETASYIPFNMRVDKAPFSDVRVRQALRLLVDRQAMVDVVYLGEGRVANDLYSPFDPLFNTEIPQREQDLDQAKSLLKAAGYPDLQVTLTTADIAAGVVSASELYAEQAKGAGVQVNLDKVDVGTYFGEQYGSWDFSPTLTPPYGYLSTVQYFDGPNATFNLTHFNDPEFSQLYYQAVAEPDDAKRRDLAWEMQQIQHERGGTILWAFQNLLDFTRGVSGLVPDVSGYATVRYGDMWLE